MERITKKFQEECYLLLLQSSLRAIPFNILVAFVVLIYLQYSEVPTYIAISWFTVILIVSIFRWISCKLTISNKSYLKNHALSERHFVYFVSLMGLAWSAAYFAFLMHIGPVHETVILLVLAGMASGSMASLSIYPMAYYSYILTIFVPIILYNYALDTIPRFILSTTFLLYVIMLSITSKITSNLLRKTITLTHDKDNLIKKLEDSLKKIRVISITDSLTGLYNRRFFDSQLKMEFNRSKRYVNTICLAFIDVDNLKTINDNFGHQSGDDLIVHIAVLIRKTARRATETVFRIGGDEFAAIFTNSTLDEVLAIFLKVQNLLKRWKKYDSVSISAGIVCVLPNSTKHVSTIISTADKILYKAKRSGKATILSEYLKE